MQLSGVFLHWICRTFCAICSLASLGVIMAVLRGCLGFVVYTYYCCIENVT